MRRLMWTIVWTGIALWSVLAFIAHSVVDWLGWTTRSATRDVPGFMPEPDSFAALLSLLHQTGLSAVAVGWLLGASLILCGAWVLDRFVLRRIG